jgi:5-methylcytosine-specific restriction enzyme A
LKNRHGFVNWLETNTKASSYTVGRYAGAIDTLSYELESYGLDESSLYNVSNTLIIEELLKQPLFLEKNQRGNRMYSSALKYFIRYIDNYNADDMFHTELLKDELEYEQSIINNIASEEKKIIIEDKEQDRPSFRSVNNRKIWSRNPNYASDAIKVADYLCEVDENHKHFVSKFNQQNYVEAHHLIPMKHQDQFPCSLDIHANIVSICLACHKQIHHGFLNDKKDILEKLFNNRKDRLRQSGIEISMEEFLHFYKD